MMALSVRQPWAWAIVQGHKPVENRTWATERRGELLIHAGQQFDDDGLRSILAAFPHLAASMPTRWDLGGLVGAATLADCVTQHASRWFTGPYGLVLANARPITFHPWRGQLGIFSVPDEHPAVACAYGASPTQAEAQAGQKGLF